MSDFTQQFTKLVETHYSDPDFNYEQLCDLLQLSRSQVYRNCIKSGLGGPAAYIRQYRLQKANRLLVETNLMITEICCEIGYTSIAHFSDNFSSEYQLSPTEFRNKNAKFK